jgi:hypothetical protein
VYPEALLANLAQVVAARVRKRTAGFCLFVGALLNLQFQPRNKLLSRLGEAAVVTQAKQIVCRRMWMRVELICCLELISAVLFFN